MTKIDLKMDVEYVCVECQGDGKELKEVTYICLYCHGTGEVILRAGEAERCIRCQGRGRQKQRVIFNCEYCRGTGYRSWIDFIKRPSEKEKEICNV